MKIYSSDGKYNCPGILDRLETLEKNYKNPASYRATKSLLELIELEMKDKDNNQTRLKGYQFRAKNF